MYGWDNEIKRELNQNLAEAMRENDFAGMAELIKAGADVNARPQGPDGPTLLIEAAAAGQTEAARVLLDNRAAIEARSGSRDTPLLAAVRNNRLETATLLLDHGADPHAKAFTGDALETAQKLEGNAKMLRLLAGRLDKKHLSRAFFDAAKRGETATVRACLRLPGFDADMQDGLGNTALILAAGSGAEQSPDIVRMLLLHGAKVDAENDLQETALSSALTGGKARAEALRHLVEAGADISRPTLAGVSILEAAQLSGDQELLPCFETARRLRALRELKDGPKDGQSETQTPRIRLAPQPKRRPK
jgi:ankyrin repeat protein